VPVQIRTIDTLAAVNPTAWNNLVEPGNPFMRYEFLRALEVSGCTGPKKSWAPHFVVADDAGELIAALPAFVRDDSYGEYIFDWAWANAYAEAGIPYYPKLTIAAPFTPATGRRILTGARLDRDKAENLVAELEREANRLGVSGIHFLCLTRGEQRLLTRFGFIPRLTHQYHWRNHGFTKFDDYLETLRAHRRKEIKRERRKCAELGLHIETLVGSAIREEHIRAMYTFYIQTYSRKWGSPYLNLDAFLTLHATMADQLVLVMARENKTYVAGAIAFRNTDRLFGRYWGAIAHYPYLHFELCLYRLIDFAIENKIVLFEAGAQGEHKFQRGFAAMPIYSSHKIFHTHGHAAIADFLTRERRATARTLKVKPS